MWVLVLSFFMASLSADASISIKAKIYDIDHGKADEDTLLLLSTGHVARVKNSKHKSRKILNLISNSTGLIDFKLNDAHELIALRPLGVGSVAPLAPEKFFPTVDDLYTPTIIEGLELAESYFRESRRVPNVSQCYNRAHVWSFEWFKNHQILSNKTWVFFTRRYIREYSNKWWFHVAPSVAVKEGDVVREKVMDRSFANRPLNIKQWTDLFMKDGADCPRVRVYSDYANYPESESCYTMRSSMFYYQPFDLESNEIWNTEKLNWEERDLKAAYLETFKEEF